MSFAAVDGTGWPVATRSRMLAAAMKLFSQYSFAGTSLQMIADELDLTKAAIYYHFQTREKLLIALMQPILSEIGKVVDTAERQRGARARAEAMLSGYTDIVAGIGHWPRSPPSIPVCAVRCGTSRSGLPLSIASWHC